MKSLLLVLSALSFVTLTSDPAADARSAFKRHIARRADGRKVGVQVIMSDVNNDGSKDAVIRYCIKPDEADYDNGGGNALSTMACLEEGIAVLVQDGSGFVVRADSPMDKLVSDDVSYTSLISVNRHAISLRCTSYQSSDARCCPSEVHKEVVHYRNGTLSQ